MKTDREDRPNLRYRSNWSFDDPKTALFFFISMPDVWSRFEDRGLKIELYELGTQFFHAYSSNLHEDVMQWSIFTYHKSMEIPPAAPRIPKISQQEMLFYPLQPLFVLICKGKILWCFAIRLLVKVKHHNIFPLQQISWGLRAMIENFCTTGW